MPLLYSREIPVSENDPYWKFAPKNNNFNLNLKDFYELDENIKKNA